MIVHFAKMVQMSISVSVYSILNSLLLGYWPGYIWGFEPWPDGWGSTCKLWQQGKLPCIEEICAACTSCALWETTNRCTRRLLKGSGTLYFKSWLGKTILNWLWPIISTAVVGAEVDTQVRMGTAFNGWLGAINGWVVPMPGSDLFLYVRGKSVKLLSTMIIKLLFLLYYK